MTNLFSEFNIASHKIKNRLVLPPMVCFGYPEEDGLVTPKNLLHYKLRSEDGAGIIIVEATCVKPDGKAASKQLGIWSDTHIPGLATIADVIRSSGSLALIQLHHAGLVTPPSVNEFPVGPSVDPKNPKSRDLTAEEVRTLRDHFIAAGVRAKKAGFDGIEIHGAHGYMLNQFANPDINKRTDEYGNDREGRMRLAQEIIAGIRAMCGKEFIIGYRMGVNTPTLDDGIAIAQFLEKQGIDYLHSSHGGNLQNLPRPPKDFDYNWIVYSGVTVKKHVNIPVIVVNEIKTAERAAFLIGNNLADFVAVGRPMLADPFWVRNVKNNLPVNVCSSCRPRCRWFEDSSFCPGLQRFQSTVPGLA
jgi:NADPH2 dehydrogenase